MDTITCPTCGARHAADTPYCNVCGKSMRVATRDVARRPRSSGTRWLAVGLLVIVAAGAVLTGVVLLQGGSPGPVARGPTGSRGATAPGVTSLPSAASQRSTLVAGASSAEPSSAEPSSPPLIGSLTGAEPPRGSPGPDWPSASVAGSVTVQYPPDWEGTTDSLGLLDLLPPTSASDIPSPRIEILWLPGAMLAEVPLPPSAGATSPVTVAGYQGLIASDASDLPPTSTYVLLQLSDGVLRAQAYAGPGVDLTPFLPDILGTLRSDS